MQESLDTMSKTESYYDTTYVAAANEINYELFDLLYEASDKAYECEEFSDIAYHLNLSGAKLHLFDKLTSSTGFASFEYATAMANSIGDSAESLNEAQRLLRKFGR